MRSFLPPRVFSLLTIPPLGPFHSRSLETLSPELRQCFYKVLPPANGNDFLNAHMAYSTIIQGRPAARLMTVLREPRLLRIPLWMFWRSYSDETLAAAGVWGRITRMGRGSLIECLNHPEAAYQTDNIAVRMLLWPHPLIPNDGFIDGASDQRLVSEALARLKTFDFVDVIENPRFVENLRVFFGPPLRVPARERNPQSGRRASGSHGGRAHQRTTACGRAPLAPGPRTLAGRCRRPRRRSGPYSSS